MLLALMYQALRAILFQEPALFRFTCIAAVGLLSSILGTAEAVPVTYAIEGDAIFDRPFGTFTYDADSNTYSNVSIWSLDHYSTVDTAVSDASRLRLVGDLNWLLNSVLFLNFEPSLGTADEISFSGWEQSSLLWRGVARRSGEVTGVNVPEPSGALLMVFGIVGVLLKKRLLLHSTQ